MIEMVIDSIRVSLMNYQRVVILKEKAAERYLPIWIGPAEADAIAVKLQGVSVPRPLTHDLLRSVIDALGAKISSIIVSDLKSDTFYAKIILNVDGGQMEIDSRPSDALALAVRAEVPIYAAEEVLDKAGILLDKETGKPIAPEREAGGGKDQKVSEDELKRMSAFYEFINTLDMDDFDKRKS
jgi:bifunctional DNase/RNase